MWNHDSDGPTEGNSDAPTFQYFSDSGNNDWDPSAGGGERVRERGTVQPSFNRYNLATNDQQQSSGGENSLDIFGNPLQPLQMSTADGVREASLSGSHNSSQFGLHENFYQDHPTLNNTGADDYGYRSNSVASNSSVNANTNRYLYERLSHDHSPSLEALSLNTSARIQSFDNGMSGIGASMHSAAGGELRNSSGISSSIHNSRHARRLYVGGIPQNQTSEELLQHFLNDVCSKCMEEENDGSYVISVYMNHKKCFAFVELKSIELTSVCLELDGIVYCNNILKIQRANEYKPELMVNVPRVPIHFILKNAPFPNKASMNTLHMDKKPSTHGMSMHEDHTNSNEYTPHTVPGSRLSSNLAENDRVSSNNNHQLPSSVVRRCSIAEIPRGALVLLGFPYDEGAGRAGHLTGAAGGPRAVRQHLYQLFGGGGGGSVNPEFGVDWNQCLLLCDVGDVALGLLLEEALSRLGDSVAEIIRRGGVPIVLGGSGDMSYANAAGLMTVAGGSIGIMSINSQLNVTPQRAENRIQATSASRLLLSDTRFCPPREGLMSEPWCEGKFIQVAAQGSQCSTEDVRFVEERGGQIVWLSKDIRQMNPFASPSLTEAEEPQGQLVKQGTHMDPLSSSPSLSSSLCSFSPPGCPSCHSSSRLTSLLAPLLTHLKGASRKRPIYISLHMEALHDSLLPGVSSRFYAGLSSQEASVLCHLAGTDENVAIFDLCGLNPDVEEVKSPMFAAQLVYSFVLGFLQRVKKRDPDAGTSGGSEGQAAGGAGAGAGGGGLTPPPSSSRNNSDERGGSGGGGGGGPVTTSSASVSPPQQVQPHF